MIGVNDRVIGRTNATKGINGQHKRGVVTAINVITGKRKFSVAWDDTTNGQYLVNALVRMVPAQPPLVAPVANQVAEPADENDESDSEDEEEEAPIIE